MSTDLEKKKNALNLDLKGPKTHMPHITNVARRQSGQAVGVVSSQTAGRGSGKRNEQTANTKEK